MVAELSEKLITPRGYLFHIARLQNTQRIIEAEYMLTNRFVTRACRFIGKNGWFVLIIVLTLFCGSMSVSLKAETTQGCDYYASPTGMGNGLSSSAPFRISTFWSVVAPGKTLCLLDGTYTGVDSMIDPPDNLSGTANAPITVRALNDGKVSINGKGVIQPIRLYYNNHFILEGFNSYDSSSHVVQVHKSNSNILRRIVAWNANKDGNFKVFEVSYSHNNLLEDVAGFGTARKTFEPYQTNHTVFRRAWGRWEASFHIGPKHTFTLLYNSYNTIIENSIGTWDGKVMNGSSPDQTYGIFGTDRLDESPNAYSKILGSIAYVTGSDTFHPHTLFWIGTQNFLEYIDNVAYLESGTYSDKKTFWFKSNSGANPVGRTGKNLTSIGGAGVSIGSDVQTNNIEQGTTVNKVSNIFIGTQGARICKRYVNGVLTDEPLWPWPMNQRIIDAMKESGKSPVDVTKTIEQMFGAIPSECKAVHPALNNQRVSGSKSS